LGKEMLEAFTSFEICLAVLHHKAVFATFLGAKHHLV